MFKLTFKTAILAVFLFSLASCGSSSTSTSLGTLGVNGPGITGSVPAGTTRLYTLDNIFAGQNYTVRTTIATLGSGTTAPDGTLTVSIYESEAAFKSDPTNSLTVLSPNANFPYIYEVNFDAPSSGNYVAAIKGASQSISDTQFFYDLRVMSASTPYLLNNLFINTSVTSTMPAYTGSISPNGDYIYIFSNETLSLSGLYPIKLLPTPASAATITAAYPQLFVYRDQSLKIGSLLYSSVTNSMNFIITDFTSNPTGSALPTDPNNNLASGVTITAQFSTGTPFIVVRSTGATSFELTVGPAP